MNDVKGEIFCSFCHNFYVFFVGILGGLELQADEKLSTTFFCAPDIKKG